MHMFRIFIIFAFVFYMAATIARANDTALPTGQEVVSGSANFIESNNQLTINQSTEQLITNWNSFNIGRDATVEFVQPNTTSSALNRVNASDPTYIYGQLKANGQVVLINSMGVIFQNGSKVDVGSIIASSLDMDNGMFLDNKFVFENKDHDYRGVVNNNGEINAFQDGHVAFIAPEVTNEGIVKVASGGSVSMLAGDKVTMHFNGNKLINYSVDTGTVNALVENRNAIEVTDGIVILSAQGVSQIESAVVNNSGIIKADSMTSVGGKVFLSSSNQVANSGTISTNSYADQGGHIQVTANDIYIQAGSVLEATGTGDGGKILIGGSWQNSDPSVQQAITTNVESGTIINASSTYSGDGGEVVVWSDINDANSITRANGTIYAKGGTLDGNGGRVETSGNLLNVTGIRVDTTAADGSAGDWLLDPTDYRIVTTIPTTKIRGVDVEDDANTYITTSNIVDNLETTDVTIQTGSGLIGDGDIVFLAEGNGQSRTNPEITYAGSGERTLTFKSSRDITGDYTIASTNAALNVVMWSDWNGDNDGGTVNLSSIATNGGNLTVAGGLTLTSNTSSIGLSNGINLGAGDLNLYSSGSITLGADSTFTANSINISADINISSYALTIANTSDSALSGVIDGARGSLVKNGSGTLTLSNANTYTGATTINTGTLNVTGTLHDDTALTVASGATYNVNSTDRILSIAGAGTISTSTAGIKTLEVVGDNNGSVPEFSGIIQDGSGTLNFSLVGSKNQKLSGSNTYTGTTSVASGGALTITGTLGQGNYSSAISNEGTLELASASDQTLNGVISGSGSLTKSGSGTLTLSNANTYTGATTINTGTLNVTGTLGQGNYSSAISNDGTLLLASASDQTLNGVISGAGSLTKSGLGTLTLYGNNTYSGGTTINAGTAKAGAGSFGTLTKTTRSVTSGSFGTGNIEISAGTLDVNNYLIYNTKTGTTSNIINKPNPTLTFSNLTIAANGMSNDLSNALTDASNGALSFAQTDAGIVNLNSTTGITSLVGNNGNSTITASTLETNEYNAAQSSYMLSYIDSSLTGSVASSSLGSNSVSSHIVNAGVSTSANQAISQLSIIDTISNNVQGSAPTTTNSSSATDQNASLNTLDNKTIKVEASKDNEEENKVVPLNVKVDEQKRT